MGLLELRVACPVSENSGGRPGSIVGAGSIIWLMGFRVLLKGLRQLWWLSLSNLATGVSQRWELATTQRAVILDYPRLEGIWNPANRSPSVILNRLCWGDWNCGVKLEGCVGGGGGGDLFDGFDGLLGWLLGFRGSVWLLRFLFCVGSAMLSSFLFFRFPSSSDSLETLLSVFLSMSKWSFLSCCVA